MYPSVLYSDVPLFQEVGIKRFHCIQRCPHLNVRILTNSGSLHITPLQGLVQLRPCLSYLDVGTKFDAILTEVTVRFAMLSTKIS